MPKYTAVKASRSDGTRDFKKCHKDIEYHWCKTLKPIPKPHHMSHGHKIFASGKDEMSTLEDYKLQNQLWTNESDLLINGVRCLGKIANITLSLKQKFDIRCPNVIIVAI